MKKAFLFILLFILAYSLHAQSIELISIIDINTINMNNAQQITLKLSNNKPLGTILALMPIDYINSALKERGITEFANIIIYAESNTNGKFYTYNDFITDVAPISPYIITQSKSDYRLGDTVTYYSKGGSESTKMNLKGLDAQVNNVVKQTIKLQFSKLTSEEVTALTTKRSLIFPIDKSTKRWLTDVNRIRIYAIKD